MCGLLYYSDADGLGNNSANPLIFNGKDVSTLSVTGN
jgi:hypothetical protein